MVTTKGENGRLVMVAELPDTRMVIPERIADLLNSLMKSSGKDPADLIENAYQASVVNWKAWVLMNPFSVLSYNIRNMTGDAEVMFTAAPGSLKLIPKATRDIFMGLTNTTKGAYITPELAAFIDLGGLTQTQQVAAHLGGPAIARSLKRVMPPSDETIGNKALGHAVASPGAYGQLARTLTDHRELIGRYAAFLHFREMIEKNGGNPTHYAGSIKAEIDAIQGTDEKAIKMANEPDVHKELLQDLPAHKDFVKKAIELSKLDDATLDKMSFTEKLNKERTTRDATPHGAQCL